MGVLGPVFRTYDPERDRLVAVKVFRLDIPPEQAAALAEQLSRIAALGLTEPGLVAPLAAGVADTVAYLAQEYVAAESLDVAMRHYAPATLDRALPFVTQLAHALDGARAAGVLHGSLHPRDVFVTPDSARATGIGIVAALEQIGLRGPVRRPYTAPERIAGEEWAASADVFSLAAIAFELVTGKRVTGTGAEAAAALGERSTGVDTAELERLFTSALAEDAGQRPATAQAFAAGLESLTATSAGSSSVMVPVPPAPAADREAVAGEPTDAPDTRVDEDAAGAALGGPETVPLAQASCKSRPATTTSKRRLSHGMSSRRNRSHGISTRRPTRRSTTSLRRSTCHRVLLTRVWKARPSSRQTHEQDRKHKKKRMAHRPSSRPPTKPPS